MKSYLSKISFIIDNAIDRIGGWTSWLTLILVLLICTDVMLRYMFSLTKTWVLELEWHIFSVLFLLGASYTLLYDQHVRVDLFYEKLSVKRKNWINAAGILIFLVPWCAIVLYYGWSYTINSYSFHEGSPNPNGLPARFIIKGCIFLGFLLLMIQGFSEVIKALVRGKQE